MNYTAVLVIGLVMFGALILLLAGDEVIRESMEKKYGESWKKRHGLQVSVAYLTDLESMTDTNENVRLIKMPDGTVRNVMFRKSENQAPYLKDSAGVWHPILAETINELLASENIVKESVR